MLHLCLVVLSSFVAVLGEDLTSEFAIANRQFTADLYKEILKSEENFLICPLSLETALSMVYFGARNATAKEIVATLHHPEDKEKIKRHVSSLLPYLKANQNYTLKSANKLFVQKGAKIVEEFKKTAVDVFNSDVTNVDFAKSNAAAEEINEWVELQTEKKIKDLLDPSLLDATTRMVLVNAMYFHGKWEKPFEANSTSERDFRSNQNSTLKRPMMEQTENFRYFNDDNLKAQFLELDYAGGEATMIIVLPHEKDGLQDLESNLDKVFLPKKENFFVPEVHVLLPKFSFSTTLKLGPVLQTLGIKEAFTSNAELDIVEGEPSKIDEAIQKTFIEVDEEGSTAAAATLFQTVTYSLPPPPEQFIADHPFLFYISVHDMIVFAGRYVN